MDVESVTGYEQAIRYQNDQTAADRVLAVRFYTDEFEDVEESKKAGRPIFRTEECVEIQAPGSRDVKAGRIRYMKPDPRKRFPEAYANWKRKNGDGVHVTGQPLKQWGLITPAAARSYAAIGIHSVEQLAEVSDSNARETMGLVTDRQKARDWLEQMKGMEPVSKARAELAQAQEELATLRDVVKAQGEKIEALIAQRNGIEEPRRRKKGEE